MSSGPDLSLVCKSCGAEVSPYITECPYCGARVQKRAPKLDRGGVPRPPKRPRRSRPQLPRLRPGEIPGIRADRRPWATWLLVLAAVGTTVGLKSGLLHLADFIYGLGYDDAWRSVTSLFAYTHTGYEIAAIGAVALFGWLLERRHGAWATLLVFFAAGAGGAYIDISLVGSSDVTLGATGAALGLLAAWAMRDVLGRRAGREDESDLLGVLAIAALLVLLPLASDEAGGVAGLAGGGIGLVLGLILARRPER
jgi:membrane associated rhomboid family serine protease